MFKRKGRRDGLRMSKKSSADGAHIYRETPQQRISRDQLITCLVARDALLSKKHIWGIKIHVVIGGFSILADVLSWRWVYTQKRKELT